MSGGMQGGYPGQAPARRPNNNGILLWSLVGCGVIALLIVVILGFSATRYLRSGGSKGVMGVMSEVTPVTRSVETVDQGLEAYRQDHGGHYPPTLDALVPKYIADKSVFVCGSREDPKVMEYTPPKPSDPDGAVVVRVHIGDISLVPVQVQKMYVSLLKNGDIATDQNIRTITPGRSRQDRGRAGNR